LPGWIYFEVADEEGTGPPRSFTRCLAFGGKADIGPAARVLSQPERLASETFSRQTAAPPVNMSVMMSVQSADPQNLNVHQLSAALRNRRLSSGELVNTLRDARSETARICGALPRRGPLGGRSGRHSNTCRARGRTAACIPIALKDLVEIDIE
jgi:hypothetical protein